jgi:hypothetical protein
LKNSAIAYYKSYYKGVYEIVSINTVEKRDEEYCRYYYTYKTVSTGKTATDVKIFRFYNFYGYCNVDRTPCYYLHANA